MTDEMYNAMQVEASEYRRLLVLCRERIICEMERADRAERTIVALLTILRTLVEEFSPEIAQRMAQSAETGTATPLYWQECDLIKQIQKEADYRPY
jgi:hypothetical protein